MRKNLITAFPVRYGLLIALSIFLTLLSCSKDGSDDGAASGTTNDIVSFIVLSTPGTIKEEGKGDPVKGNTIDILIPRGNALTNLTPTIAINGQSIAPGADEPQDFSDDKSVDYTVTAENGSTKTYTVRVETQETVREITRFVLAGVEGTIDRTNQNRRIELSVPGGTNLVTAPDVIEFEGERITPEENQERDFSETVTYTVTADDNKIRAYEVIVDIRGPSTANDIEDFFFTIEGEAFAGTIDQDNSTISVNVPNGTDVTALAPTIEISEGARVNEESGVPQNFTNPVTYTVTAENGDQRAYVVTVGVVTVFDDAFILTFENTNTVTIPTNTDLLYDYQVDKDGDGIFEEEGITGTTTFTFATQGPHTIGIRGLFPAIQFGSTAGAVMADKVTSIDQWGKIAWLSMKDAFKGCVNMEVTATDVPVTNNVADWSGMFEGASKAKPDVTNWNVRFARDMSAMFRNALAATPNVANWGDQIVDVTDMSSMFEGAMAADPDVENWNVSNVRNMSAMFKNATSANPDVSAWNVDNVDNMSSMFEGFTSANLNVGNWTVNNVTTMARMFAAATNANPDVSEWNVSKVDNMSSMFEGATSANPNVANWAVNNVTNMSAMFKNATRANPANLNNWRDKVSRVTDMSSMFEGATNANPDVIRWNVGSVQNMASMFKESAFNRRLEWRSLNSNVNMANLFDNSALSTRYYTIALYVFGSKEVRNVTLGSAGMQISDNGSNSYGDRARNRMGSLGWTIGGPANNGSSSISNQVRDDIVALNGGAINISKF